MTKTKIALVATMLTLAMAPGLAWAEDAASASFQIRVAANDTAVTPTPNAAPAIDPDRPKPIKKKLHRSWKKSHSAHKPVTPAKPAPKKAAAAAESDAAH